MKEEIVIDVIQAMLPYLNSTQSKHLQGVLEKVLLSYDITIIKEKIIEEEPDYIERFISAKRIEGCSENH